MKLVRGSEVSDFLRCRLRWKYAWVDGYKSKKQNGKLFIGTLIHKYLESWHAYGVSATAMSEMLKLYEETDTATMDPLELNEMWDMAFKVTRHYSEHYTRNPLDIKEVLATEFQFAIPLDDDIVYSGTIDLLYLNRDDLLYFEDHKTTDSIVKYEKNAIMDRQISRYWWALQQLTQGNGYIMSKYWNEADKTEVIEWVDVKKHPIGAKIQGREVHGFRYNILLKAVPEKPELLKKGGLSKNKAQNTTYELYLQAIEENGLNKDDYLDFLQHLAENGKRFFSRIDVNRLQPEIDSAVEEFYATTMDSKEVRRNIGEDHNPIYRNITADCSWDCAFRDVCIAGMDGSNVNYLLNIAFNKEEVNNGFDIQKTN